MSNLRSGPTNSFRPTRTTRSTAAASGAGTSAAATTSSTRPTAASRPLSAAASSRPGSSAGVKPPSRPGSVAGFSFGATRGAATLGAGPSRASAPPASGGVAAGVKRKTRAGSSSVEQESSAAKRPALTSAFSAHVTQTSLNRQLLAAQAQVTELQNKLLNKDREIDRLEADLRLVATREEEEKEARQRAEEEFTLKTSALEYELSSLKRKFAELESHHEDLDDAYSTLLHTSQSKTAALNVEITTRDEQIELLQSQLQDAQARAREEEIRAKALEELLEQMTEEEPGGEDDEVEEHEKEVIGGDDGVSNTNAGMRVEIEEPATSVDDDGSSKAEKEDERDELDADGEADPEEDPSMAVDTITEGDVTQTGEIEISSIRSRSVAAVEPNVSLHSGDQNQPEIEAYPDPGAPPPYTVSSPISASASIASRSRSASIASSQNVSIASSRAMSLTLDRPLQQQQQQQPTHGTPLSISSNSRLDPLSHIRHRLSLGTPNRRRRHSSTVSSHSQQERERISNISKDNEIIRTELSRLTSHLTSLEASNTRLTSELSRLRSRAQNSEILREEKRELERRLLSMEGLRTRVAKLETNALAFAKREKEWELKLRNQSESGGGDDENNENCTPGKTPVGVTQQLTTLRKQHATLLDEHGQLKATLRAYEVELTNTRSELESTSSNASRLQKEIEHLQDTLTRKEKECVLLERDAMFLRSLVSSYQNEEAANITVSDDGEVVAAAVTEKLEQRIAQLESLLEEYKSTIEGLEGEVERLRRSGGGVASKSKEEWDLLVRKAATLEEAFKNAQSSAAQSTDRIDQLEQRLFELGGEIGAGRHIPPNTRVLTLQQNPAQEWADTRQEVLDKLKAENEALLERLKELESRLSQSGGPPTSTSTTSNSDPTDPGSNTQFVPRASYDSLKHETSSLSSLLAQKEKRLLRLQQVYSSKSIEFREAIESIMGVKLAFYPNGQVRVTSVYDLSAAFVFSPAKPDSTTNNEKEDGKDKDGKDKGKREGDEKTKLGARMQLIALGDHVPEELEGLMNMWIRDEMCIPCFMSSVTLECYDKWKREQAEASAASGMS
ncbi:uncharacterized protein FOMMEDRAFT_148326 [Fomitiporia mediterranea MF3/22]|uniref:uncharacterized protein n=1 Tax=Fomitiporia mediterranea (strain MF3/22) TaxID=694068 RepID=UPI000440904A|nr:uncharacterized protein FOMMEDRAFT_148326 [Fomitiporia mediterranea MF3/22]EJD00651.1 hypothetical protein FOMMEDRAFT_148326 [Fomitiporia mediterranea MF3/22]